jgi:dihydrofolate reductase
VIVSFLAAVDRKLVLGDETGIPWRLPADLKRFRRLSLGKPIVMGRTTFEHIGRPLDKRVNIVLTRRPDFTAGGVLVAHSMEEALSLAGDVPEVVIVGGGEVYRAALPWVNRLYLTFVDGEYRGTAYFPAEVPTPPGHEWTETHREAFAADEANPVAHTFVVVELVEAAGAAGGARRVLDWAGGDHSAAS